MVGCIMKICLNAVAGMYLVLVCTAEHDKEYDHETFLGKDVAREYETLTDDQSKEQLGKLFHQVDKNGDGGVTEKELEDWMRFTHDRYVTDNTKAQMNLTDSDEDGKVSWDEYKSKSYTWMEEEQADDESRAKEHEVMMARDRRRFDRADADRDTQLNIKEFAAFLHPESDESMKGIVVEEVMEDMDKDSDGRISLEEFIGQPGEGEGHDWVTRESEQFSQYHDVNKDGYMDKKEATQWVMPDDYHYLTAEAKHLITESDVNKDGQISKDEMVDKFALFAGSHATDFGEALTRLHTEL